jgi:hypothetical protein
MERQDVIRSEIKFSSITPRELWRKFGLTQPKSESVSGEIFSLEFMDDESRKAFEAFRQDCPCPIYESEEESVCIVPDQCGLVMYALMYLNGHRGKKKKLSSINHIFKDELWERTKKESKKYHISIEEKDLDDIASFLQTQGLVRTSQGAIRITQNFADRFHHAYHAWLTF